MMKSNLNLLALSGLLAFNLAACQPPAAEEPAATTDEAAPVTEETSSEVVDAGGEAEVFPTATIPADALGCAAFTEGTEELNIAMADVIKAIDEGCLEGQIQFIDARPQIDYESGHIAGAINVPFHSPQAHFAELPKDKWLISYCECPNSEALQVANALTKEGGFTKVKYIAEGLAAWRDYGRELVEGPEAGTGDF